MDIKMARGDMETCSFVIRSPNGDPFTETFDNIYMTVKKDKNDRNYKFQKRLSDGGIYSVGEGQYQFTIEPEDTDNMAYGEYLFDIEFVIEGRLKKTFVGTLILLREVTHHYNEVVT